MTTGQAVVQTTAGIQRRTVNPWWVGLVAGMASFVDGAALVGNGFALVIYQQAIGLTPDQIGMLTSVLTFGVAIGSLVGGRLGDRFGRRRVFIVTMIAILLGAAAPTISTSFGVILAGLALLGLAIGADIPVSLATIAEAATDKNRGKILVLSGLLWGVGIAAAVVVSMAFGGSGRLGGQLLYGMIAVVALVVLVLRLTIPESESWLLAREERRRGVHTVRAERTHLRDLLKPPLRRPFLALAGYFTLISVPVTVYGSYAAYIAANFAGVPVETFSAFILAVFPLSIIVQLFFMRIVDTRFRLTFYLAGGALYIAGYLIPAMFGFSLATLGAALIMAAVGGVFCGEPIFRVWANESFPTMLRSTAQGFLFAVARIVPALLLAPIPVLLGVAGQGVFYGMSALGAVGVFIGWWGFRGGRVANEFDHEQELDPQPVVAA